MNGRFVVERPEKKSSDLILLGLLLLLAGVGLAAVYSSSFHYGEKLTGDSSSQVRTAALNQLGDTHNPKLLPFFKRRFDKDDSYQAQAAALLAIGKCGSKSDLPFLEKVLLMESPRNTLKRAAERAVKHIELK